jgi:two-component system, NarL family, response regulator NreC
VWKIIIADDQHSFRQEVKDWLENEPGFEVVGEARDGIEAVEVTENIKPDILISDLKMPRLDGIGVTKRINDLSPGTRVIILSMYGEKIYVDAGLKAGARGYVMKKSIDELKEAIRTVGAGKTYLSKSIS